MSRYKEALEFPEKVYENYRKLSEKNQRTSESDGSIMYPMTQSHVHEFESSTKLAEEDEDRHNHRVAGVTSQVIPLPGGNHKHAILSNTDFFDHHHEIGVETGPAVPVGDGKHVHFVRGMTTIDDGHFHNFAFATLIEAPLLPLEG